MWMRWEVVGRVCERSRVGQRRVWQVTPADFCSVVWAAAASMGAELLIATAALPPSNAEVPSDLAAAGHFPFVASSDRISGVDRVGKIHKVVVGPPESHLLWRTFCGWHFGGSEGAKPLFSLPSSFKLICERCNPIVRVAAREVAIAAVTEPGEVVPVDTLAAPPSQSRNLENNSEP